MKDEFIYHYKSTTKPKEKIKPKVVKVNVDIMELEDKCSSKGYFKSCRSLLNVINRNFGWPDDILPIKKYEEQYDEIIKFLLDHYLVRDHVQLGSKTAHIINLMKLAGYNGPFITKQKSLYHLPIDIQPAEKNYESWDVLVEKMKQEMSTCRTLSGYMVLLCYIHGYPLRLGDIVKTSIHRSSQNNWLDLDNNTWYILKDFTKNRRAREFKVSDEFVSEVRKHIHPTGMLVCRRGGQPYKSQVVLRHLDIHSVQVNEVRNSFETWNYAREDVSEDEKNDISVNVLGHEPTTARAYYVND